jgi:subtilisin family serine protease
MSKSLSLLFILSTALVTSGCLERPTYTYQVNTNDPILGGGSGTSGTTGSSGGSTPVPLTISPSGVTLALGGSTTFKGLGGTPPYTFTSSGGETIGSDGKFQPGPSHLTRTITLRDSVGSTSTATVTITIGGAVVPNDPYLSQETSVYKPSHDINAVGAWGISTNCKGKPVAVLDTGIDLNHPDLAANVWTNPAPKMGDVHGWNFVDGNSDPTDQNFHGTHVSGTIGAIGNNGQGVAGICWQANIIPVRFLDQEGSGDLADAVDSINYATNLGAKIINASWGIPTDSALLSQAVQNASNAGVLFVAAAGNGDANGVGFNIDQTAAPPASYGFAGVISVAAVDDTDTIASFSNFGPGHVVISAPGVNVLSTFPSFQTAYEKENALNLGPYYQLDGTSMATPHVSGAIALFWSLYPSWSAAQVKQRLISTADRIPGLQAMIYNGNRLNVKNFLVDP